MAKSRLEDTIPAGSNIPNEANIPNGANTPNPESMVSQAVPTKTMGIRPHLTLISHLQAMAIELAEWTQDGILQENLGVSITACPLEGPLNGQLENEDYSRLPIMTILGKQCHIVFLPGHTDNPADPGGVQNMRAQDMKAQDMRAQDTKMTTAHRAVHNTGWHKQGGAAHHFQLD